ncbi:MAG: PucR family transcriptional regulator ligand-binding domain-containing protein, partial [Microbacteriaceae bacterium]
MMTLTSINDLLSNDALSLTPVFLPPGAAETQVSWVHSTEQLDPRPHLRHHELVCTLGSALVRPGAAEHFVAALAEAEVAGVVLGLGEVHLQAPEALVDACREASLPLLLVEHGVPFLALNDAVLERRAELQSEARRREIALLARLFTLARKGAKSTELTAAVEHSLSQSGGAEEPSEEFKEQFESLLEFSEREDARATSEQQSRLGQLTTLIVEGLALPQALAPELEAQQLSPERLIVSRWPAGSERALKATLPFGLIATSERDVILISEPVQPDTFRKPGLVCGFSSVVPLAHLGRALTESRSALRIAKSRGGVTGPHELASLEALLEQQPAAVLETFFAQLCEPLLEADEIGRGDLVTTLSTFFDCENHLQHTAQKLFVHVNTIRHRFARV